MTDFYQSFYALEVPVLSCEMESSVPFIVFFVNTNISTQVVDQYFDIMDPPIMGCYHQRSVFVLIALPCINSFREQEF